MEERELVGRIAAGDRAAMRWFYDQYSGSLTATCSRYVATADDVKDVLQESFIRIFASMGRFEWRGPGALRAWSARIVVNESLKYLRERKKLRMMVTSEEWAQSEEEVEPDFEGIPQAEILEMIRALPDGYRTVFNLYVFEQKSHREIALMLGIAESSSASQFHRARGTLARMIKKYGSKNEQRYG
jgi:RNA polymerase sigma-70 factor (ECF subfamily)